MMKYTLATTLLLGVLFAANAQPSNIFHQRDFWRGNPPLEEIKAKIAEGNSPTALTPYNFDAISYAILEKAPLETIKFLLTQGNEIDKLTHDARTYLMWAAYKGDLELMKYLVDQGANTDIIDQHGYSLFMFPAATGLEEPAVYDYIIELGADVMAEKDRQGRNALLAYAGSMKTGAMIDYFVTKGLDVHGLDEDGNGIFNHAAKTGNQSLLETLVADYKVNTAKNAETNENAILFASRRYSRSGDETSLSFYQYLEGLGLDATIVSNEGETVLHNLAYRSKNIELYEYFVGKGIDVNQTNEEGNNALINASASKSQEIVAFLVKNTEDINHQNKEGIAAFTRALKYNDLEVAQFLVSKGADPKIIDKKGYDMGYHVVDAFSDDMEEFKSKMDYLASTGYDPTLPQEDGSTLLHLAIQKHSIPLAKSLVGMGIDINAKDNSGQTALHLAAMQAGDEEMLKFLIESGADKTLTTDFDESAYDLASTNELLIENKSNIDFLRLEQND
ncbi:MAG: ankyrin repeat domain-containing protein [Bacteroidota bacterium]